MTGYNISLLSSVRLISENMKLQFRSFHGILVPLNSSVYIPRHRRFYSYKRAQQQQQQQKIFLFILDALVLHLESILPFCAALRTAK